jgi:predicted tellurium resistance membrane protein TerC
MIGTMLVMEGAGVEIDKGYVYFAMAFAGVVEAVNSRVKLRKSPKPRKRKVKKVPMETESPDQKLIQ